MRYNNVYDEGFYLIFYRAAAVSYYFFIATISVGESEKIQTQNKKKQYKSILYSILRNKTANTHVIVVVVARRQRPLIHGYIRVYTLPSVVYVYMYIICPCVYITFARAVLNKAIRPHPTGSSEDTCNVGNGGAAEANSLVVVVVVPVAVIVPFVIMTRG